LERRYSGHKLQKLLALVLVVALVAIAGLSCAPKGEGKPTPPAAGKTYSINLALSTPAGALPERSAYKWVEYAAAKSGGSLVIHVYPTSSLYSDKDFVEVIPSGACDMAICNTAFWTGSDPALAAWCGGDLTTYWSDKEHFYRFLGDKEAKAALDKRLAELNCKYLGVNFDYSEINMITKEKVACVEDMKGMKIRGFGETCSRIMEAWGAEPVVISSAEQYDTLMKGVVDGILSVTGTLVKRKLYEGAKYIPEAYFSPYAYPIFMNLDKWNSLPKDIQNVLVESGLDAQKWCQGELPSCEEKS
jgi:TRAP-type C4-dicarboxylate transport system, periplasmic component